MQYQQLNLRLTRHHAPVKCFATLGVCLSHVGFWSKFSLTTVFRVARAFWAIICPLLFIPIEEHILNAHIVKELVTKRNSYSLHDFPHKATDISLSWNFSAQVLYWRKQEYLKLKFQSQAPYFTQSFLLKACLWSYLW